MPTFSVNYETAYAIAREKFAKIDPFLAAGNTDTVYEPLESGKGQFRVPYFKTTYVADFPTGMVREAQSGSEPALLIRILILHYLTNSTGQPLTGEWVNFRQLPDGLMYQAAFTAQSIQPIIRTFGHNLEAFLAAGDRIGGERARLGDGSFIFRVFPKVLILVTLWLADDELPPSGDILFDASVPFYLTLEDIDAIGRDLGRHLLEK